MLTNEFLTLEFAIGTLSSCFVAMSNFNMCFASSLFCYAWLLSIRSMFYSKERQKGSGFG